MIGQIGARSGKIQSGTDSTQLDYEEGSFTVTMNQASISSNSTGYYTKIGNLVFFQVFPSGITPTSGQSAIILGLPFMPGNKSEQFSAVSVAHNGVTDEDAAYVSQHNNRVVFTDEVGTATYNTSGSGRNVMVAGCYTL
jgi:hypothetical protein